MCELIKGKGLEEAVSILDYTPKRGAKILAKTLMSAVANARNLQNVDEDRLFVKTAVADDGPTWKRSLPRAHMRDADS